MSLGFSLSKKLHFARICLCLFFFISLSAYAKRVALVIGNDNYFAVSKLQKAGNDATAIARELKLAGFSVQLYRDLNYRGMVKAIEVFARSITGGDEVVFFFAGHGIQIKNGSYLLPTDIEASSESEVEKTAYELLALTDKINESKPAFTLLMIDACRDNPLKTKGRNIGGTRGLSAIEPPKGHMIVYSASRGQQALDRLNENDGSPNGVFTREFIARMRKPGIKIEDLMREVQDSVESLAMTISHEQRPAIYNEARGNFYFFAPLKELSNSTIPILTEEQKDEKFWQDVKAAGNKEAFEAYLKSYPNGKFVDLAKANIAKLANEVSFLTKPIFKPAPNSIDNVTREIFSFATEKNDPVAQVKVADFYQYGRNNFPKDEVEAEKFYRIASNAGNSVAQLNLGVFYRDLRGGLTRNDAEAVRLFKLSADQGNAAAQDSLAHMYRFGRGVYKNEVEAARLFLLSAEQGNFNGQNSAGHFYANGLGGLPKDDIKAEKYFRLAANKGHRDALVELGKFYENGRGGLPKDESEAVKLYKTASNNGGVAGQVALAEFYEMGKGGLEKNTEEALRLYRLAAEKGNLTAQNKIKYLTNQLQNISNKPPAKVTYTSDIFFGENSTDVDRLKLNFLLNQAKTLDLEVIIVLGHASNDEKDPRKLSHARAEAIKSLMVAYGITPNRVYVDSKGASQLANRSASIEIIGTRIDQLQIPQANGLDN